MASGDTLSRFTPLHNEPTSSSAATLDTRNLHPVLDYDATLNEYGVFSDVMPRHYGGNGVTVYVHAAFTSATSGSACWAVSFERIGDGVLNIDGDSFATAACVRHPAHGTAGTVTTASVAFANGAAMDSIAVGEGYRLKLQRVPGDDWDDASGDAEMRFIEVKET